MQHRDSVTIRAPRILVWTLLEDLELYPGWHPKLVEADRKSPAPGPGAEYDVIYTMNGKATELHAVTTHHEPPARIVNTFHGDHLKGPATESFTLTETRAGTTRVDQRVAFRLPASVPAPLRALVWLLLKFGRKRGEGPLDSLRATAEEWHHGRP
mgnify:CR=1 FL=1